mgnify:CR=1 FL=1
MDLQTLYNGRHENPTEVNARCAVRERSHTTAVLQGLPRLVLGHKGEVRMLQPNGEREADKVQADVLPGGSQEKPAKGCGNSPTGGPATPLLLLRLGVRELYHTPRQPNSAHRGMGPFRTVVLLTGQRRAELRSRVPSLQRLEVEPLLRERR